VTTTSKRIESIPTLTNRTPRPHADKKELAFNDIKADLTDCERNFKLMETDIASLPPQQKMDYLRKVPLPPCRSASTSATSRTAGRACTKPRRSTPWRRARRC
jgi:hypothetical protein